MAAKSESVSASQEQHSSNVLATCEVCAEHEKVPEEEAESTYADQSFDEDGVPYDRGWSWVIVCGAFVLFVLLAGYAKSTGIFFEALLQHYGSTHTHTALLFAIKGASYSIGGLFVMNILVGRLGVRKTVLIGVTFLSLSAILSSVANQLTLLLIVQATLLGLADVMTISPTEVLTAKYFRRRRNLAFAIVKCGASVGAMSFPALVTFFLSEYGLKGAFLLSGAVCLHSFPAALLLRPTSYFSISKRRSRQAQRCPDGGKLNSQATEATSKNTSAVPVDDSAIPLMSGQEDHMPTSKLENTEDSRSAQTQMAANDTIQTEADKACPNQINQSRGEESCWKRAFSCFRSFLPKLDFSVFRYPVFRLLFVCFALFPCVFMAVDYLPATAKENGISETRVAILLTIIGACDMLSRFASGVIADRRWTRLSTIVGITFVVLGVMYHCVRFLVTSFSTIVVMAVIQGLMGGVVNCLIPGLVVDCVGVDKMAKGLGFYQLAAGSFLAAANPAMGYIRDVTGSYFTMYHVIGSLLLLAAVLLFLEGPLTRATTKKDRRNSVEIVTISRL